MCSVMRNSAKELSLGSVLTIYYSIVSLPLPIPSSQAFPFPGVLAGPVRIYNGSSVVSSFMEMYIEVSAHDCGQRVD